MTIKKQLFNDAEVSENIAEVQVHVLMEKLGSLSTFRALDLLHRY